MPQRAAFGFLGKWDASLVGGNHVMHPRPIAIEHEPDEVHVIKSGLGVKDIIVLAGSRQVKDGDPVEHSEFLTPERGLTDQKSRAE